MTEGSKQNLLVELGCEELPPKALAGLARAFFEHSCDGLEAEGIELDRPGSRFVYSPRRMALMLSQVAARQPDRSQQRKGPAITAAFDADGQPTKAALGFARSVNTPVDELERLSTAKGEWLSCTVHTPGKALGEVLFEVLDKALKSLPVPRPMRWSDHDYSFVRPVHWLVVLYGEQLLEGQLLGCAAGRQTQAHRIHAPGGHTIEHADQYLDVLHQGFVIADHEQRKERVRQQATELGQKLDARTRITDSLLDEVTNLVEWPVAVCGQFDEAFLEVPTEALIASMEGHQKFFPVLAKDPDTTAQPLTAAFIVVANIDSLDPAQMIAGFERVVRPRLADAQFFWKQDQKTGLSAMVKRLDDVVFQKDLGSIGDKSRRLEKLSLHLAEILGINSDTITMAAPLCKADLNSQMVGEFPELQGVMGAYLARAQGDGEPVAAAIESHYLPRFAGDLIPADLPGQIIAIADRLDTVVGVFAAGQKPSGNKDPFALRRASLGIIRILLETGLDLRLDSLIEAAARGLVDDGVSIPEPVQGEVMAFMLERARHYFMEHGASARQVAAVLAAPLTTLADLRERVLAVQQFMQHEDSEQLIAANKRIGNILKKQETSISTKIDKNLLVFDEERQLIDALMSSQEAVSRSMECHDYGSALATLARLRAPVDAYFDTVMVMDEDPAIRANRLATLSLLKAQFDAIADFSVSD